MNENCKNTTLENDFLKSIDILFRCSKTWNTEIIMLNESRMDKLTSRCLHEPPIPFQKTCNHNKVGGGPGFLNENSKNNILSIHHINCRSYVKK